MGDALDPLASLKVLAVMCFPTDPRGREILLRRVPGKIVFPRNQAVQHAPGEVWTQEVRSEVEEHRRAAYLAGAVALSLAQLQALRRAGDVGEVLSFALTLAMELDRLAALERGEAEGASDSRQREAAIAAAFESYRSVSHLWAALVYGKLKNLPNISPRSIATLPTFLAYAEEIARLATGLQWNRDEAGLALDAGFLWTFILPAALRKTARAQMAKTVSSQLPAAASPAGGARLSDNH